MKDDWEKVWEDYSTDKYDIEDFKIKWNGEWTDYGKSNEEILEEIPIEEIEKFLRRKKLENLKK